MSLCSLGVARSAAGHSAALRAEPVPVSGLRPAAVNARTPKIRLFINYEHVALVLKVRRALGTGEGVRQ